MAALLSTLTPSYFFLVKGWHVIYVYVYVKASNLARALVFPASHKTELRSCSAPGVSMLVSCAPGHVSFVIDSDESNYGNNLECASGVV